MAFGVSCKTGNNAKGLVLTLNIYSFYDTGGYFHIAFVLHSKIGLPAGRSGPVPFAWLRGTFAVAERWFATAIFSSTFGGVAASPHFDLKETSFVG